MKNDQVQSSQAHKLPWGHKMLDGPKPPLAEWRQVFRCLVCPPGSIKVRTNNLGSLSNRMSKTFTWDIWFCLKVWQESYCNRKRHFIPASYYQHQDVSHASPCLHLEKIIHAFLSSNLDYCNSLYTGISECLCPACPEHLSQAPDRYPEDGPYYPYAGVSPLAARKIDLILIFSCLFVRH